MNTKEVFNQLQEAKEILQAIEEIPTSKFLTCKEYNTILLNLVKDSYEYNKNKEAYDLILNKLFNVSIIEVEHLITIQEIKQEQERRIKELSKPLTSKPTITNS
jgi:hypothetical protein|tara:strand:- start:14 stop:325 length:312 start_codon:yes stop_codon:yes gene_type:complete